MAAWLRQSQALAPAASKVKVDPPRPVAWGIKTLTQPARWLALLLGVAGATLL
ncbi:hypothetical protein [Massilia sp. TWR1-2-2]|uniref:hypothetical protein n=1 Tax=Massilia sp. TWR1-2-2 TaxID=2804584 RepID=UPI003CED4981